MENAEDSPWEVVHRSERVYPVMPRPQVLTLLPPPASIDGDTASGWSALLPLLGSLSALGFALVMRNVLYLAISCGVAVATVGGTYATRKAARRKAGRRRRKHVDDYLQHLHEVSGSIEAAARAQRDGLEGLDPRPSALLTAVRDDGALWERRPEHADFGAVRLGLGAVPALVTAKRSQLGGHSVNESDDVLAELATGLERSSENVSGAPVTLPIMDLSSVALVGPTRLTRPMLRGWIARLCALQAPSDLQVMGYVDGDPARLRRWDWVKWLPHTMDAPSPHLVLARTRRTFSRSPADLVRRLTTVLRRTPTVPAAKTPPTDPATVVVVDRFTADGDVAQLPALERLLREGRHHNVTTLLLCAERADVPAGCGALVEVRPDGTCAFRQAGADTPLIDGVLAEAMTVGEAEKLARWLAGRSLAQSPSSAATEGPVRLIDLLPSNADGVVSQPASSRSTARDLQPVPLGLDGNRNLVSLRLDEAAAGGDGPHGVVVGATGSGKSELLRTIVAGLAARHPPGSVDLLLVDYKGGAAFDALSRLPHVAGLVTNLADEPGLVARVSAALSGELARRQRVLRESGHASIRAQWADARTRPDLPVLAHLVVVIDEFGELLAAEPEFLETLVRVGRLGRSLGVHLLLGSQRLEEGRLGGLESHLRFRIALKTFTASESIAVLGSAAAYDLPPRPGLGLLKVDSTLTPFQSALASAPVRRPTPADRQPQVEPFTLDQSVPYDESSPGNARREGADDASGPSDLDHLVDGLLGRYPHHARAVWLPPLPPRLAVESLPVPDAPVTVAVGLIDEPLHQRRRPLIIDLARDGGVAVVGAARSGRSTFMCTLVRLLASRHHPGELQVYALDLGGGGLAGLSDLPHVGAVASRHDDEVIREVLAHVHGLVRDRTSLAHSQRAGVAPSPTTLLLVDHLGQLRSDHADEELRLSELAALGPSVGVHLIVSASRWLDLRPGLLDALGSQIELGLSEPADSRSSRRAAEALPRLPGRGLTPDGLQFQLAVAPASHPVRHSPDSQWARQILALPLKVEAPPSRQDAFPLGVMRGSCDRIDLDLLAPGAHLLIHGDASSGRSTLLERLITWIDDGHGDEVVVHVVDPARALLEVAARACVRTYTCEPYGVSRMAESLARELAERRPSDGLDRSSVPGRSRRDGPHHVLVVDDHDLLLKDREPSPLSPLIHALTTAAGLGLHVVLVRQVSGHTLRTYEAFGQRLREQAPIGLLLSGEPTEGHVLYGVAAAPQPPGRGTLLRSGQPPVVVQTFLPTGHPP